ncbi:MAG: anhydro-N-acetylmuramic acid kinase [Geminicoccaceae bacterium]|nr:anhydro-N-acetylmuramic acid kinase [Geminicoccaceae bacterium]MDW8369223.1 anhydro-N-acetylmuramic acid kinase [Geminicoccaceae bacterium]
MPEVAPRRLAEVRAKDPRIVAGLMTGTSMDGLDLVLLRVPAGIPRRFELLAHAHEPMPADLRAALAPQGGLALAEAARLDRRLGAWFADGLERLVRASGHRPDLVGCHGQTVYHEHGVTTCQLGEPAFLAERLGCPVVSDFRRNDIAAGGCGAPLVPIVDRWLLERPGEGVLALNLGGIANLTAIPPAERADLPLLGFDCGPANMVLDELARRFSAGRAACDRDGALAARGRPRAELLDELLADPRLLAEPPRSLGREEFGSAYVDRLLERARPASEQDWCDLFATASAFTARCIARAIARRVPAAYRPARLVASGGGVRNPELARRIAAAVAPLPLVASEAFGLPSQLKEAIAFALLASARLDEIAAGVPSVTGARRAVLLGKITEC